MEQKIKKTLNVLESMVKDAFKDSAVKIVLFGSRARGDYVKSSDYGKIGKENKGSRKCLGYFARGAERTILSNCERRYYSAV
jgi:hypothetical protein